jgi:hypothetical protein
MMTEPMTQTPLAIDRVERARAKRDHVRLRLSGRWLTDALSEQDPTLLVVQLHGKRLRFPAGDDGRQDAPGAAAGVPFTASFTVPDWAVPEQPGQAVLWVGEAVVPVPPPGMAPSPQPAPPPAAAEFVSESAPAAAREPVGATAGPATAGSPSGRSGPLAQLLHKDTVTAQSGTVKLAANGVPAADSSASSGPSSPAGKRRRRPCSWTTSSVGCCPVRASVSQRPLRRRRT